MKHMDDLIEALTTERDKLKTGEIEPKTIAELNNNAGKIINASKVLLEYQIATKGKENAYVKFLDTPARSAS